MKFNVTEWQVIEGLATTVFTLTGNKLTVVDSDYSVHGHTSSLCVSK